MKVDKWLEVEMPSRRSAKVRRIDELLANLKSHDRLTECSFAQISMKGRKNV
jgi:hypothetical protein